MNPQDKTEYPKGKRLTPLKAIKAYYLDLCGGSKVEVKLCQCINSPVYHYRFGSDPWHPNSTKKHTDYNSKLLPDVDAKMTPIKAIRAQCIDCSGGSLKEVRECAFKDCPLHPYRMGKNPYHKNSKEKLLNELEVTTL